MAKKHYSSMGSAGRERRGNGIMHDDRAALAHMPRDIMAEEYEPLDYFMSDHMDYSIRAIDSQINNCVRDARKDLKPRKA